MGNLDYITEVGSACYGQNHFLAGIRGCLNGEKHRRAARIYYSLLLDVVVIGPAASAPDALASPTVMDCEPEQSLSLLQLLFSQQPEKN